MNNFYNTWISNPQYDLVFISSYFWFYRYREKPGKNWKKVQQMDAISMECMLRDVAGILLAICWESPVQRSFTLKCQYFGFNLNPIGKLHLKESTTVLHIKHLQELVCIYRWKGQLSRFIKIIKNPASGPIIRVYTILRAKIYWWWKTIGWRVDEWDRQRFFYAYSVLSFLNTY